MLNPNRIRLAGLLIVLTVAGTACSLNRTASNEWGCLYGGGPFEKRALKQTVAPGDSGGMHVGDDLVKVPSDVRFYIIDSDPNTADAGGRPIEVPARGTSNTGVGIVNVSVETQVRFTFNENVCKWYDDHGRRNEPLRFNGANEGETSGWDQFLNTSMNQKLIEAARPIVARYRYDELYVNSPVEGGTIYSELESKISENLARELQRDLGDSYFCGPSYVFDGDVDGEFDCPALEVTVKRVVPVKADLITKLETIVANEEEQKVIESNKERQLAEITAEQERQIASTNAEKEKKLAQIAADEEAQLAEQRRREAVGEAQADAELAIQQALNAVAAQQRDNELLAADAAAAFCVELAAVGIDCALLEAAKNGAYPRIILGDQSGTSILLSEDG